ncbi:MAG: cupin domain-containing protein [Acidothermus cellulolyticus]|jgi:quercetin dioxygenase-like cupin family protein|nr:cupin domain-containing protein [Acidothermus cellulolyticus]
MRKTSLTALGRELLEKARQSAAGRAADTVYGGHEHHLRQTLVALTAGSTLAEHESPGEATLHVLFGRIRLLSGNTTWEAIGGDLLVVPEDRHRVEAVEDSSFLLSVVKTPS